MQNRGAIKVLVVLLALACLYQLSFTFVAKNVEKKAARYAATYEPDRQLEVEQNYLDSVKSQTVFNLGLVKFNYKQVKERELNLGLDLRGGMNVMLQIAMEDVVVALSNDSKDPVFNQAIAQARELEKTSNEDFITLFARTYNQLSNGSPLAYIFNTPELRNEINPQSSNDEVIRVLRRQTDDAISNSFNVLRNRIDRFGVTQPNIQRIEGTGRILVELPGVKEPERVRKLLQGTASLEFWATYNNQEIFPILERANNVIREMNSLQESLYGTDETENTEIEAGEAAQEISDPETDSDTRNDLLAQFDPESEDELSMEELERELPLFSKLKPNLYGAGIAVPGPSVGWAFSYDTAAVNKYFDLPQVKALLPRDLKLMWDVKGFDAAESQFNLYAIRANTRDGKAPLDGSVVTHTSADFGDRGSSAEVSMTMNGEGSTKWARLTADNVGSAIAIVLDGYVYSAPNVSNEITGGSSRITGNFTIDEARDLANVLKSGKLPAPARIISDTVVGPTLGAESIRASMISFFIAFLLVLLYMIFFYNKAGLIACVALVANLFFLFGVLVSFGAVLTLPGIAGIVLTMGMAVDANVIIYERIKEELRSGKGMTAAIDAGFKNAMSAIIDSNVTTIITGIVLFRFGTGPVQGFATTLIIGILTSLFCAIFITRLILASLAKNDRKITFSNKITENFLSNTKFDFLGKRKISYIVSGALILLSIVALTTKGMNYGVDFTGGRAYVVRFDQYVSPEKVNAALVDGFADAPGDEAKKSFQVKQFGSDEQRQVRIVTQYLVDEKDDDASEKVEMLMYESLGGLYSTPLSFSEFTTTATNENGIISTDMVGASVANETVRNSFIAVFFSLLAIGLYIILRFRRWQWAAGSVIALAQDAFLTIGAFCLFSGLLPFSMEVDQSFIAAILTIIGYSINDKVVIFDRIREYFGLYPKRTVRDNMNAAINSTLSRTINTSGTTLVTLLAIFLFGGVVIRGFIFALIIGVIIGTLSSIFTATPLAYDFMKKQVEKK